MKPDALQAGISASDAARTLGVTPAMAKEHLLSTESKGGQANGTSSQFEADSTNTTIFVGGLKPNVTDEDLRQQFSQYGEIVSVKIPIGKGCGFVQFAIRNNAEEALQKLNGTMIDKMDFDGNHWSGTYYEAPVYDGYGYALSHPHDPSIYAAAYAVYPIYGGHQQEVN